MKKNECENCIQKVHWSYETNPLQRRILASKDIMFYKWIPNSSIQGV